MEDDFRAYLHKLDAQKPVILCGDLNVAKEEIDLKNPKTNRRNAGFTDEEREKMRTLLASGFTDTFRYLYPDREGAYSWWSYRFTPARSTPDGASTISSSPGGCRKRSAPRRSGATSWDRITAR